MISYDIPHPSFWRRIFGARTGGKITKEHETWFYTIVGAFRRERDFWR